MVFEIEKTYNYLSESTVSGVEAVSYYDSDTIDTISGTLNDKFGGDSELHVSPQSSIYSDLQEAINDASSGDVIVLHASTYEGNYIVNKDLTIRGDGQTRSIITSSDGVTLTLSGSSSVVLKSLSVRSTPNGTTGCHAIKSASSATNYLDDVHVMMQATSTYGSSIYVDSGSSFRASACTLQYFNLSSGGGTHSVVNVVDGDFSIRDTSASLYNYTDSSDYYFVIYNNKDNSDIKYYNGSVTITSFDSGFTGVMAFMRNNASAGEINSAHNMMDITGTGDSGNGIAYCAADGTTIHSSHNRVNVEGFEFNRFGNTWTSGTIISHFDDIVAPDEVIGDGTYSFVNSPANGDIEISGAYRSIYSKKLVVAVSGGDYDNIYDAISQVKATASGSDKYLINIEPGVYTLSGTVNVNSPYISDITGVAKDSVIFKPIDTSVTVAFNTPHSTSLHKFTIDGRDFPSLETTSGTIALNVEDDSYNEVYFDNINIRGYRNGIYSNVESNIYCVNVDIRRCGTGVRLDGDYLLFDADNLYIEDSWDKHFHISNGEAYIADGEFNSTNTSSGTAVYVEGDGTYMEIFGGTNVWGVNKNIVIRNNSSLLVDNCVIEDAVENPGIEQKDNSTLRILNSRAPLSNDSLDIQDATNVYINAYDSDNVHLTLGTGSDEDQAVFSIETGRLTKPHLWYETDYYSHKGFVFKSPSDGENTILGLESTNEDALIKATVVGNNAWSHPASLSLYSDQSDTERGWIIRKEAGSTPELTFSYLGSTKALQLNSDGSLQLNTGSQVNKILDEDAMGSDDASALATQQSIKAYVDDTTYSQTALNNGQLDSRYYTEAEVDTISGALSGNTLYADGSKPLTSDWDAGSYEISAGGFNKDNTQVDLAVYANSTGILTGGGLSINAGNPYMLDVTSGTSLYVDITDPDSPVVEALSWPSQSISGSLDGNFYKWIGIYRISSGVGGLVTDSNFSALERRTTAVLGKYWSTISGSDEVTNVANYTTTAYGTAKTSEDFIDAYGAINIIGNKYSVSIDVPMQLARTAGKAFRKGANRSSQPTSPNIYTSLADNSISSYYYQVSNSYNYTTKSGIDPNYYDVGGVLTAVPSGKWTVQRVYYFAVSNVTVIFWGQHYYDSSSLAYDGIHNDTFDYLSDSVEGAVLRAYLIVKQGATDLTDEDQAVIHTAYGRDGVLPGLSNHGELGGLADDDHPQYLNEARGDDRYYTKSQIHTISGVLDEEFVRRDGTHSLTADWDAGDYGIKANHFIWNDAHLGIGLYSSATGLLTGGSLSINSGNADYLDIASGTASYVDMTDPSAPITETLTWSGATVDGALGSNFYKWVGVYRVSEGVGDIITDTDFTALERRTVAVLGKYWSTISGSSNITNTADYANLGYGQYDTALDFMEAYGAINITGNNYSASTTSGTLARTAGEAFRLGANTGTQPTSPNIYTSPAQLTISSYYYQISGSYQYDVRSVIDPNTYDLNGTQTSVPSGKWTVQRIYYFAVSNVTVMLWGQHYYNSKSLARDGIYKDDFELWQDTVRGGILRGYLIVKQGATDLTDTNQAEVFEALGRDGMLPGISNHGELGGLQDDNHPQYHNNTRGDVRYYLKSEVDYMLTTLSGNVTISGGSLDHGDLLGLSGDDHPHYVLVSGTRDFVGIVGYDTHKTFSSDTDIPDKKYVDDEITSNMVTDHGNLSGLGDDDHAQYSRADGTRDYTSKVSYSSHPTFISDTEIVDKKYVDDEIDNLTTDHGELTGLSDDDHTQYHNNTRGDARYYTQTQLNNGQLDNRYYTEAEVDAAISAAVITDHGNLSGLGDDDHTIYTKADGSRNFTNKVSYSSHPTFTTDTEIVDKKYVDDEIDSLTTDHGELTGLGDDDHSQYHNDARGDVRYYTKSQISTWRSGHTAASGTDHDGRYYTETEVDELLTSVSGSLSDQIDAIETGDLPSCQIRRTTDFSFPSSWGDVTFDTTDIENDTTVLEHDDTNTERINIKETGMYIISYKFQVTRSTTGYSYARILKNGSTLVAGSEIEVNTYTSEVHTLGTTFVTSLQENDYIALQAYEGSSSSTGTDDTTFMVASLRGLRGEQGPAGQDGEDGIPGAGSTINVSQDGTIFASFVENLNFVGATVTSGVDYTTVNVTVSGSKIFDGYDGTGGTTVGDTWVDIPFATRKNTGDFDHTSGNAEVEVLNDDSYLVLARATTSITTGTDRTDSSMRLVLDTGSGYSVIDGTTAIMYNRTLDVGENTGSTFAVLDLNEGDKIKAQVKRDNGSSSLALLADGSSLIIFSTRGPAGEDGEQGPKGDTGEKGDKGDNGATGFGLWASARVDSDGTVRDSFNLSVVRSTTGTYDCTFDDPAPSSYYQLMAQPYQTVTDTNAMTSNVTASGFTITIGQGDNGGTPDTLADTDFSVVAFYSPGATYSGTINHDALLGLDDDDHPQYVLVDGTRGFSNTVSGVEPTQDSDLATKEYVDKGFKTIQCYSSSTQDLNQATVTSIPWDNVDIKDDDYFTHSTSTNNSRIYVDKDGWYEISYNVFYDGASGRSNVLGDILKNGVDYIQRGRCTNYTRNTDNHSGSLSAGPFLAELSADDYIEFVTYQGGDSTSCTMEAYSNYIRLTFFRSSS